jgi:hypothetical protein
MKPVIDPAFWSDPDIEAAKTGVKLCALWLITNSQTSMLGVCGVSEARFAFETGLPADALTSTLKALHKSFVRVGNVVFVKNFIRHQFGAGEKLTRNNRFRPLKSLFASVKDPELRKVILAEYPEFKEGLAKGLPRASQALAKGLVSPSDGAEVEPKSTKAKGTLEDVLAYFESQKLSKDDAEWFFYKMEGTGWRVNGKPVRDWQGTARCWNKGKYLPSQKQAAQSRPTTPPLAGFKDVTAAK